MRTRNVLLAVLAGLLIVSMSTVLLVSAQESTATPPALGFVDEDDDGLYDYCGRRGGLAFGRGMGAMMGARWSGESLVDAAASTLGIEAADIQAELEQGKSLREIIAERGGDPDAVVEAFVAARRAAVEEWLDSGSLEDLANQRLDASGAMGPMGGYGLGGDSLVSIAAELLGVETDALVANLQESMTLREAIQERGGDPDAVVAAFVAARQESLDAAVAEGNLTADQAAAILERVEDNANDRLDSTNVGNGMLRQRGIGGGRGMGMRLGRSR
ncbi:MAG: hypothetical protein ACYC5M_07270 [Anaerolineae bacterium]